MNIDLIRKILSTKRVHHVAPDNFQFDFGLKIRAVEFDTLEGFQESLALLCEHPEFTVTHLQDLLGYLND